MHCGDQSGLDAIVSLESGNLPVARRALFDWSLIPGLWLSIRAHVGRLPTFKCLASLGLGISSQSDVFG